jgi:hypothetical protein
MRQFVTVLAVALVLASPGTRISAADPSGESAHVALTIDATTPQGPLALTGTAAYARRGSLIRIDLTQLAFTGGPNRAQSASPLPPGGYTLVYDVSSMMYMIWSPSRHRYFSAKGSASPSSAPTAKPAPSPSPSESPGPSLTSVLASLKDLRQFVVSLTLSPDKTPIEGHPTTNFDFRFTRQLKAQEPTDVTGRASFADDLGGIPLLFTLSASGGKGNPSGNVRAELSAVKQSAPPQADFAVPAGYTKASSLFDVLVIPGLSPAGP